LAYELTTPPPFFDPSGSISCCCGKFQSGRIRPRLPVPRSTPFSASMRRRVIAVGSALRIRQGFDLTGNDAAAFGLKLAVADLAQHLAGGADGQPVAAGQVAVKAAADIGVLDFGGALELAGAGDLDVAAIAQHRLDLAFDNQRIAGANFAVEEDVAADDELLVVGFLAL